MGPMARAVISTKISRIGNGQTDELHADPNQDDPLGLLHSFQVMLGVPQVGHVHRDLQSYLLLGSMAHKQWLAPPLDGHVLAFQDVDNLISILDMASMSAEALLLETTWEMTFLAV